MTSERLVPDSQAPGGPIVCCQRRELWDPWKPDGSGSLCLWSSFCLTPHLPAEVAPRLCDMLMQSCRPPVCQPVPDIPAESWDMVGGGVRRLLVTLNI